MIPGSLAASVAFREPVETIVTMEAAAQSRLLDAMAIGIERPADALTMTYLLGYVVECTLKAALGRVRGLPPGKDLFSEVRTSIPIPAKRHDLTELLTVVFLACPTSRAANDPDWRAALGRVAGSHSVGFRYESVPVRETDLGPLLTDVEWIVARRADLWT